MAGKIKSILVGDKEYKVQMLSVLDSIDLQMEFITNCGAAIGQVVSIVMDFKKGKKIEDGRFAEIFKNIKAETLKPLKTKILERIITPENRILSDETEIERWFSLPENQGDVWEVLWKGAQELLGEYLPSFLKGMTETIGEKMTETQLKFPQSSGRKR